ncbi:HNH endonuclease signature motif containing protein [Micromonospora sp. CPCC 206061]|uniref:HNH endonuclease signature motif containing protein n=1 Tax=Micromonospora sp. CPCC 206061 TaxID=3122410 RepID=UPI002FEEE24D
MPDADLVAVLDTAHALEQLAATVKLHAVREVDGRGIPAAQHATSVAVWLRQRLRVDIHTARRMVELARQVERRPGLDQALASGAVSVDQAQVIATAIRDLPDRLAPEVVDAAESLMVGWAKEFEPRSMRQLSTGLLAYVAPELADEADRRAIERDEKRAQQTRAFALSDQGDGRYRVTGWLDAEAAATVSAALDPLCRPSGDERSPTQRRADALVDVCKLALGCGELPDNGGDRPQVVVTVPFDVLRGELGVGQLDCGDRLSAEQVRKLACDARIMPVVLGGDGQVLDAGQARRLFTGALRRALVARDGGCAFPGCDRPARWCHGHHVKAWTAGGATALDNGVLLCGHHHRVIHQGEWQVRMAADGRPEFIPPAYLDPARRPRRNTYHLRT